jgi:uncharacterized protein YfaS (alpha-2-macroglobulin family)
MKIIISITAFIFLLFNAPAQQADYPQLKLEAERNYTQGSYSRANEIYSKVDRKTLAPAELRWVEFRLADTSWRAQAATSTADTTKFELAEKNLTELIRTNEKDEDRDIVWAEAHESLGDFYWRRDQLNWGAAWPHYQQALDWWAGQREIEPARERYLKIVFRAAQPPNPDQYYYYSYYGNYIPLPILENALKISRSENEKARLHFLIAMTMRNSGGDWESRQRVAEEFEEALKVRQTEWYDDALFNYAEWMNSNGSIVQLDGGQWQQEPDYIKALELYRRLISEFRKGESRYYDQAQQQIRNIVEPNLGVGVSNIFLPDSEVQFGLNARNLKRVDFSIFKIDLPRDVRFTAQSDADEGDTESGDNSWIQHVSTAGRAAVKSWTKSLDTKSDHKPTSEQIKVETKLPVGAYLIEARSGSLSARDLLLVTDTSLVLKASATQALAYFSHAITGAPIANATVALWESYYISNKWRWRRYWQTTNSEGLAMFQLKEVTSSRSLFAAASVASSAGARQAFVNAYTGGQGGTSDAWRIYAFTDRPAYRPKETVQWKFIARRYGNGQSYSTPSNQVVEYQISDPRGAKVSEGKATLNVFGSAWGSLELTEQLPLGEYNIQFWNEGRVYGIGNAKLFRLEEYKLPEFKVAVKTPEQDGKKKAFRLGEQVEVDIQADYYFGGPVGNASVEVVVYQNPFYHYWHPYRDYPWYYEDIERQRRPYYGGQGQGQIVKRETIKTDATGKAKLTFDTPRENYNQDFEYRIEARVTDSSRREIVASDTVRVTRQRYYVYPRAQRNIYRPGDKVIVDIKALDANEQPVTTEGTVKVTRDYWWEVWLDPAGREVKGEELRLLRAKGGPFPAPVTPGGKRWRLKFRGYEREEILTQTLKTDAEGNAELVFTPQREGYFRVAWESSQKGTAKRDRFLPPIKAETAVFVASTRSTDLGYRYNGVQIIVDKDTVRAGQTAPVMLFVPEGGTPTDRYVLFSVEGEDLYSYRLVHMTGTAKLIELPIEEKHVPNIYLSAAMVSDAQLHVDTKQIVVPPVDHFLSIDVKADREQYQPREEGTLTVTAKDANGKPVSAEIALGLVDESVKYIQQDYAGDPRQFYYGTKRPQAVQTQSTFNQKSYIRLVDKGKGQLIDFRSRAEDEDDAEERKPMGSLSGGVGAVFGASETVNITDSSAAIDGISTKEIREMPVSRTFSRLAMMSPGVVAPPPPSPDQEPAVQVRTDFRSTIFWQPDVRTDADGVAIVKVTYPDSLTTWSATARAATAGNQFGIADAKTRTKQPLIVRLQSPRFFVVGDQVTVSAVINNNTDQAMSVASALKAEGVTVTGLVVDGKPVKGEGGPVQVKPGSEARVDWLVSVTKAGEAKLKVEARGGKYADAMEKTFSVYEHGIEKFVSRSGKMRSDSVTIGLDIPKARRTETTELSVQVAPSMATTMLDALPYLIDYPYGCTEQTMSRFLPAAITAKTLRDLGLKPETAMQKIFGGIEEASAATTHPKGKHDLKELDAVTRQGLDRLYNFQHADGGWGWWKEGESDHFMTAYVLWGMTLASQAGIEVKPDVASRAAAFLDKELVEEEANHDAQAWMLHALAVYHAAGQKPDAQGRHASVKPTAFQAKAFDNLWANRDRLNAYTRALLALSAHHLGYATQATTLLANLENGVKIDLKPDTSVVQRGGQASDPSVIATAHWGEDGVSWRWSEGGVEATAFALRAFLAIDPKNKLVEPVTNWLIKNRRGSQWSNTRDTAIVVLTLNDYLKISGELSPVMGYELLVNGKSITTKQITADDALSAPSRFAIPSEAIRDGANEITIRRTQGTGPIYFSAEAKFFSLEEPIAAAGNEIFVRRQYFKLVNHPTLLKGFVSQRLPLNDGETVKSGDRVEVVLTIEAKNNYEYLLFEDLKPGGLEAVEIRSGESLYAKELKSGALAGRNAALMNFASAADFTGRTRWVYQELRDRKVAMFIDKLPEGVWQLSYEMRAESPGQFHALPVLGHAMYVPEIRTNGAEVRIRVVD